MEPRSWNLKGLCLYELKKYDEAISAMMRSSNLIQRIFSYGYQKKHDFKNTGRIEEAINCFNKLIEIDNNNLDGWNSKARMLAIKDDNQEAISITTKSLEKEPNNSDALRIKGLALYNLHKYKEAIKCYDKAIQIHRNDAEALYNRACSKIKKGDIKNYIADLKKSN